MQICKLGIGSLNLRYEQGGLEEGSGAMAGSPWTFRANGSDVARENVESSRVVLDAS